MGEELTSALDQVEPSASIWRGPYPSPYGWHLIMMTARRAARLPAIAEIQERVTEDYQRIATDRARRRAVDELVAKYQLRLDGLKTKREAQR
jgi:parvulin-like peptidyl-prolyl isomerase